jgi:hypothetical protein
MGRRITTLDEEFAQLFRDYEHTAFRLETLQRYAVDYETEPIRQFLAGEPMPDDPSKDDWCKMLRAGAAVGKRMARVHVVIEPLTVYLRYELGWSYPPNVAAGEDIRILPVGSEREWPDEIPFGYDFWLFDSRDLWVMAYGDEDEFLYAEHITDPVEVVRHNHIRDAALHAATEFHTYMSRHPGLLLREAS